MFETLEVNDWLKLNAGLQQKKCVLRNRLNEKGVLTKGKENKFDNYKYFSEAQYKELFTELFSKCKLELKFNELEYGVFETNSENRPNGRCPRIEFTLFDCETGFGESTIITGEAVDKGDKAGYKAYTGALKYYLANTFMVATGDDPEDDSPENSTGKTGSIGITERKASPKQVEILVKKYTGDNLIKLLQANNIEKIEDISSAKASDLISQIYKK